MIIEDFDTGLSPGKKGILAPILLACLWCVLAVALLWVMATRYRARIAAVSLTENRFITTEWSLLQELKVQTDAKLLEKDQEIADLRGRYLSLSEKNASPDALRRMQIRLEEADLERKEILSRKSAPADGADASGQALQAGLAPLVDPARLPELLTAQIRTLQAQLEERRLYARVLEDQLMSEETGSETNQAGNQRKIQALQAELAQANKEVDAALVTIQRRKDEAVSTGAPGIEDLNTWTLLRALVSSPAIRAEYPDLLQSMEKYLELYGRQERLKGNLEAYSAALSILESLKPR